MLLRSMNEDIKQAVGFLRKQDGVLKKIIDDVGICTLSPSKDYYNSLVKSIISQQLSTKAANTIYNRFLEQLNYQLNPGNVLRMQEDQFKRAGISRQKKSYLLDLSTKFLDHNFDFTQFRELEDDAVIDQLTTIKGIGRWSAEMFLIFCLNRLDVLPLDDVGFKKSYRVNYEIKGPPSKEQILWTSKKWVPYRSIAVWYLWQSIDQNG